MIEYRVFNREELERWQAAHPIEEPTELTDMHLNYFESFADAMPCAVLALDNGRLVGRTLLTYSELPVAGRQVTFVLTAQLYVLTEYRQKAVGIGLVSKVLNLGLPCLMAGTSFEMKRILEVWRSFYRVDRHPIFPVALSVYGILTLARRDFIALAGADARRDNLFQKIGAVVRTTAQSVRACHPRVPRAKVLPAALAVEELDSLLQRCAPIQVPWRRIDLIQGLRDEKTRSVARVVEAGSGQRKKRFLISIYFRGGQGGAGRGRQARDAFLNEIYPPVREGPAARALLALACRVARQHGAEKLFVCAMTEPLLEHCQNLGLAETQEKTVFVCPNKLESDLAEHLRDPENWWCRALNEAQFEEAWPGRNAKDRATNELLV